jgi:nickel transport protein
MGRIARHVALLIGLIAVTAGSASAHKINLFATAAGQTVSGEVYVDASTPVADAKVQVFVGGEVAHETNSDAEGKFEFNVACRAAHRIVATAPGGHRAEWTVPADELPGSLPPCDVANTTQSPRPEQAEPTPHAPTDTEALEATVEEAVARQVAPLRRQIREYEQRVRLHDIIGGVGYIVGLFGVASLILSRRK